MIKQLRPRKTVDSDEGIAMLLVLFVMLMVTGVTLAMTALVVSQSRPTQFARKSARTVNAASTGLQIAVDQLRAANDGAGNGSLLLLPCTGPNDATLKPDGTSGTADGVTFSGPVSNQPGALTYRVSVSYFLSDPSGKDLSWLQTNAMACPLAAVPLYSYLQSTGLGAGVPGLATTSGNRGVHAIYQFKTSNTNVAGGRMIQFGSASPQMCLDAGASPAANSTMTMQPCQALGTARQTWQYRHDLSIFYGGDPSLNLCIQVAPTNGTSARLQPCFGTGTVSTSTYPITTTAQAQQEWSFNDSGHFASPAISSGSYTGDVSNTCIDASGSSGSPGSGTQAATGALLVVVTCDGITTGYNAWNPDPSMGAGKAGGNVTGRPGTPTNQLVNYAEFGRCLDVTGQNTSADHLIDYPCKQAPDASRLTWNQVWTYTPVSTTYGTISTSPSSAYCLTAPAQTATRNWVIVTPCVSGQANQQWQTTGQINGDYTHSYEVVSKTYLDSAGAGACMTADKTQQPTFGSSNITVAACDGSLAQKWNAPPVIPTAGLGNIAEQAGGTP